MKTPPPLSINYFHPVTGEYVEFRSDCWLSSNGGLHIYVMGKVHGCGLIFELG